MAGIISENYLSRGFTISRTGTREIVFDIQGTEDEAEVEALMRANVPGATHGLALTSMSAEPVGGGIWKGTAKYDRLIANNEFTFAAGGGTRHVTQSIETMGSWARPGETAPDFQGAIGVSDDKVEGADLPDSKFEFTETHYLDNTIVTTAYRLLLARLCSKTMNDADFKGFSAGECALDTVTGTQQADELWALTYKFSASPNVTGLTVGDITDIDKLGFDYLWIRYEEFEDDSGMSLVQRPTAVYVERVLVPSDYSQLGIGV